MRKRFGHLHGFMPHCRDHDCGCFPGFSRSRVHAVVQSATLAASFFAEPVVEARIEKYLVTVEPTGSVISEHVGTRTYRGFAKDLPYELQCGHEYGRTSSQEPSASCQEALLDVRVFRWVPDEGTARHVVSQILDETLGGTEYRIEWFNMTPDGRVSLGVTATIPTPVARFIGRLGRMRAASEVKVNWAAQADNAAGTWIN